MKTAAGAAAESAARPRVSVEAVIDDLRRLRTGYGIAQRIDRASRLRQLEVFNDEPQECVSIFWRCVDELGTVAQLSPPSPSPGRLPPSGREWQRLLGVLFNRPQERVQYTDRLRTASTNVPADYPGVSSYYQVTTTTSSRWSTVSDDAVVVLARWLVGDMAHSALASAAAPVDPALSATSASLVVSTSQIQYSRLIVAHEHGAARIDRIPKRLSVLFKSEAAIAEIAAQRFGPGSSQVDAYVEEHAERKAQFFRQLQGGLRCREIYSMKELSGYLTSGFHGQTVRLDRVHLTSNVQNWLACLDQFPGYMVALTSEAIPFKYEIVNGQTVVIHEAVGGNDRDRLNALFITSATVGRQYLQDFDLIWDRTDIAFRKPNIIANWIDNLMKETP